MVGPCSSGQRDGRIRLIAISGAASVARMSEATSGFSGADSRISRSSCRYLLGRPVQTAEF